MIGKQKVYKLMQWWQGLSQGDELMMRWSEGEKVERNVSGKKGYWRQV